MNHSSGKTHARTLWDKHKELYARKTGNKQMMYLRYQDITLMTDHMNAFSGFVNKLSGTNVRFDDEVYGFLVHRQTHVRHLEQHYLM